MAILGAEAQSVAVAWQVYQITHSALKLGLTGLALFLPGLIFMLAAGHAADRYDRKAIILLCYGLQAVCTAVLLWLSFSSWALEGGRVWPIYVVLIFIGMGRAFSGPASSALLPSLVPKAHFVNAVTWGATIYQIANMSGPAVGGLLFTLPLDRHSRALARSPCRLLLTLFMLTGFLILIAMIRPEPVEKKTAGFDVKTVLAGLEYVWKTKLLLGSISLDLFAVMLGGAVASASHLRHGDPARRSSRPRNPSRHALGWRAGRLFFLSLAPSSAKAGATMLTCVGIFGVATIAFGLSRNLWVSLIALVITGASDMVSVVVRSSMLQLAAPPEMRGRVSAVNWLFVGASNRIWRVRIGPHCSLVGSSPSRRHRRHRLRARHHLRRHLLPSASTRRRPHRRISHGGQPRARHCRAHRLKLRREPSLALAALK